MIDLVEFEGVTILKSAIQAVSAVSKPEDSHYTDQNYEFFVVVNGVKVLIKKPRGDWNHIEATAKRLEFLQLIGWE